MESPWSWSSMINSTNFSSTAAATDVEQNDVYFIVYVFWGILMPIIAAFGFFGNALTMLVLFRREMASSTILYLRALVITDTLLLVLTVSTLTPFSLVEVSDAFRHYRQVVYPKAFIFLNYAIMSTQSCNVWITVCVSFERFIQICYPFVAPGIISRKSTLIIIAAVTVLSAVYNLPHIFAYEWNPCTKKPCSEPDLNDSFGETWAYKDIYRVWLYIALIFLGPLVSLIILSCLIIRELMSMRRRRVGTNIEDDNEANMTLVLVLIVVVFILCQTLGLVTQFDKLVDISVFMNILAVSNTLYVVNSSVTFYIYVAVGKKFRNILINKVIFPCFHPSRRHLSSNSHNIYQLTVVTDNGCRSECRS